jgi:hypothetical protein
MMMRNEMMMMIMAWMIMNMMTKLLFERGGGTPYHETPVQQHWYEGHGRIGISRRLADQADVLQTQLQGEAAYMDRWMDQWIV